MWNKLILKYCILAGESRTSHHNAYLGRHREDRLQKDAHVFLELRDHFRRRRAERALKRLESLRVVPRQLLGFSNMARRDVEQSELLRVADCQ